MRFGTKMTLGSLGGVSLFVIVLTVMAITTINKTFDRTEDSFRVSLMGEKEIYIRDQVKSATGALRTAAALFGLPADPVDFALKARAVENDFVGLPCGIMDQFAVSVGAPGHALFLDTRTLDHRPAPIPQGHAVVVIHSGVRHRLTDSGYTTRVAECKAACEALGVPLLSDLDTDALPRIDALPVPLNRRARHVITDNRLTKQGLAALEAGNARAFGRLMIESHATERDNYEITVPETDALAEGCLAAGALGARQTGGGFGGSVVALVPEDKIATFCDTIQARFPDTRVLAVS